ncbi:MAG: Flp pilus assembly protein CpaB [Acidobacteria bacterium]|nr:Flp pilus assembly protein CpaB [Acidobacteriota bacterium]
MKRNLFPFLGIAFVVAIAATGVFYGLFVGKISGASPAAAAGPAGIVVVAHPVDRGMVLTAADLRVQPAGVERPVGAFGAMDEVVGRTVVKSLAANEPVTAVGLSGAKTANAGGLAIPKGMRAISIRVSDSAGLVPYLRTGNHVDIQSFRTTASGEPIVRTLLSNVEVLNVHPDAGPQPSSATVLNLLVQSKDVERVALADSAAKVRIVLRNSEDKDDVTISPSAPAQSKFALAPAGPRVNFQVRMAAAAAGTVREITARAGLAADANGAVRIGLLPADWKAESALPQFERAKSLRMLATENVDSPQGQEVSFQAGGERRGEYDLRLRLTSRGYGNGVMRVRVRPELTLPERGGVSSRRFSADFNMADGQSVLVAGFERDASAPALIDKLFRSPAAQPPDSELLLVVTPHVTGQ